MCQRRGEGAAGGQVRFLRFNHKLNILVANSSDGRLMIISIKKNDENETNKLSATYEHIGRKIRNESTDRKVVVMVVMVITVVVVVMVMVGGDDSGGSDNNSSGGGNSDGR